MNKKIWCIVNTTHENGNDNDIINVFLDKEEAIKYFKKLMSRDDSIIYVDDKEYWELQERETGESFGYNVLAEVTRRPLWCVVDERGVIYE